MNARLASVAAAAALLALGAGCGRAPPPNLSAEPGALLAEVVRAQEQVKRVQGQARVKVDGKGFSGTVTQFIAAEKPDRVHVETLDFFGNVAAILVSDGATLAFYDAREKVLYRGASTPENVGRLLPMAIDTPSLVTMLCGSAPLVAGRPVDVGRGDGVLRLVVDGSGRRQTIAVGEGAAIESSRVRLVGSDGSITDGAAPGTVDLRFEVFRRWGGARFPTDVRLRSTDPAARVDLHWTEVEVNGAVDADLFVLKPPRGARVVDLEGSG